jgi:hypothetical protein
MSSVAFLTNSTFVDNSANSPPIVHPNTSNSPPSSLWYPWSLKSRKTTVPIERYRKKHVISVSLLTLYTELCPLLVLLLDTETEIQGNRPSTSWQRIAWTVQPFANVLQWSLKRGAPQKFVIRFSPDDTYLSTTLPILHQSFIQTPRTHRHRLLDTPEAWNNEKLPFLSRDIMKST